MASPSQTENPSELPSVPFTFAEADLGAALEGIDLLAAVLADEKVRQYLDSPRISRRGKLAVLREILEPRVHPALAALVLQLIREAGVSPLTTRGVEFTPAPYAAALVATAELSGRVRDLAQDLVMAESILGEPGVRTFLGNPAVETAGKQDALHRILAGRVCPALVLLVVFMLRRRDLVYFTAVKEACHKRLSDQRVVMVGELVSSKPVSESRVREIERAAEPLFGMVLQLALRVEPSLLGGVIVRAGNRELDGTVDRQLELIEQDLLTAEPAV